MQADKHAYLLMARAYTPQLAALIKILDHPNNDIFVHIDRKSGSFTAASTQAAQLIFTARVVAGWGAYSLVTAELLLLQTATSYGHYRYYHLLSEADLPLRSNAAIHAFFAQTDREFVAIEKVASANTAQRIKYRYLFQNLVGKQRGFFYGVQRLGLVIQSALRIDLRHNLGPMTLQKGSQWFSITDGFARYLVQQEPKIKAIFGHGRAVDELFVQTMLMNSPFAPKFGGTDLRLTVWPPHAVSPATLTTDHWDQIKQPQYLFARKFSPDVDAKVIDQVLVQIEA